MTTISQQIALDNALVAPENQCGIGKCNMRINPGMKPKEHTHQVILDSLALTTCYPAFLIIAKVLVIYMHQEILNIFPKILGHEFNEPPSKEESLSFIRELGHSGEIKYITDEDLAYQIDNKDSKKQDKMYYPKFMKAIIHYFLIKDKSISMRNRTFMHIARDDSLLGAEPPKPKKTQKKSDSAILSKETPSKKKPSKYNKDVPSTKKPTTKPKLTKKKALVKANRGKCDGTDFKSGVPDEQQCKISGTDEETGDSGKEKDNDEDESEDESDDDKGNDDDGDNDDNDDDNDHERTEVHTPKNYELTDKEDNANNIKEENEEEKDDAEELYMDVNVNLRKEDVEMTNVDQGREDQHNVSQESGFERLVKDAHVTLTAVHDTQKTKGLMQSSFVSSDFTDKLLNFENASPADNEVASLMDTTVHHEEPSS
ncbi:hypothetical protein Tco_0874683 [Tanacetum coccineum]|uniref:Uncharacterized protein n=1 Tax=Tanacetum coccineum TaxID=301880 RepID=A0ABQ5BQ73_9ASTR